MAPEANGRIRDDLNQTPNPIASHLSDVYSIGCTIIDFLRLPMSRYSKSSRELLDLDLDFTYQYYPYSRDLVDLARECVSPDPKDRPSATALYRRTRRHVEVSYDLVQKASQANNSRPGTTFATAFAGQMLWDNSKRERYRTSDNFRDAYKDANDWMSTHSHEIRHLDEAAIAPLEDNIPPVNCVAIGNGLGGYCKLAKLEEEFAGAPLESYLATMKVCDALGHELVRRGGEPILRFIGQDRLITPKPNLNWQQSHPAQQAMHLQHKVEEWAKVGDEEVVEKAITWGVQAALDEAGGGFLGHPPGQQRHPQRPLRADELPQSHDPGLAPKGQQDTVTPQKDLTPTRRTSRTRRKAPVAGRGVVHGRAERIGSSRARQQGSLGFKTKNPIGRPDLL